MQRYFLESDAFSGDHVRFSGEELHHIFRVMRYAVGDQVIACNRLGQALLVQFTQVNKDEAIAYVIEKLDENRELPVEITLAQGLAKGEKMDLIVQKATEMGATQIIPFTSSRTIVKLNDKKESNRIIRWQKIAKEAAEQAHRSRVPEITEVMSFRELLSAGQQYDLALIAYEQEDEQSLRQRLQPLLAGCNILVVIGPEGGFSEEEISLAKHNGYVSISLGNRILRTETAGIAALAIIGYHFEQ